MMCSKSFEFISWANYLSTSLCILARSDLFSLGVPLWTRIFWINDFLRHQTKWPFKLEFQVWKSEEPGKPRVGVSNTAAPIINIKWKLCIALFLLHHVTCFFVIKILLDLVLYLLYLLFTLFSYTCSFVEHNGSLQWENIFTHLSIKASIKVDFG